MDENQQQTTSQALTIAEGPKKAVTKFTAEDAHEVNLPSPNAINFMTATADLLVHSALVSPDVMGLNKQQVARYREMGFTPEQIQGMDFKSIKANMMAKMLVGREMGMEPMAALQDIDIVKGKIFVRYPQLHRLIEEKGWTIHEIERTHQRAAIILKHPERPDRSFEFTIEDALRAGLSKRNKDDYDQYQLRPRVMLWSRVISEAYRATGGKGSIYAMEEKREILDNNDGEGRDSEAEVPTMQLGRKSEQKPDAAEESPKPETVTPAPQTSTPTPPPPAPPPPTPPASAKEPDPAPQAAPPERDNVREMPKPAAPPPATPAPPTPPPAAAAGKPSNKDLKERLLAMTDLAPGVSPNSLVSKTFQEFLRGFLNVSKLPAASDKYDVALRMLEQILKDANLQKGLLQDPHGAGTLAGAGYTKLVRYTSGWPADCIHMAVDVAVGRYADTGGSDLCEFFDDPAATNQMSSPELRAFLTVLWRCGSGAPAMQALRMAEEGSTTLSQLILSWNLNFETATQDQILACLGARAKAPAAAAAASGAPAAPATATAEAEDDFDDLFNGLPPDE